MDNLRKIMSEYKREILKKQNVIGVGIGQKMVRGERTDEKSIIVFVKKKEADKSKLRKRDLVPSEIAGVKTDVIEIGEVRALPATDKVRPAYPGVSIGHYAITAGTLGAVVRSKRSRDLLILSNNHVLANVSNGVDGRAKNGDPILQPGPADGGKKDDIIAHLEYFVPLRGKVETPQCNVAGAAAVFANRLLKRVKPNYRMKFEKLTASTNRVDAAVAKPVNEKDLNPEIPGIGRIKGAADVETGEKIKKVGRTSGFTEGTVDAVDVTIAVDMGEGIQAIFEQQIVSNLKSLPGDSGSIVLNEDNQAIGLLFAGASNTTVINPIKSVLEELEIELI